MSRLGRILLVVGCAFMLTSCANFRRLRADLDQLGEMGEVRGWVEVDAWDGDPIIVAVLDSPPAHGHPQRVVRYQIDEGPGNFTFFLDPGDYRIGAFEDSDRDGRLTDGERGAVLPDVLHVQSGQTMPDVGILVSEVFERPPAEQRAELVIERGYEVGTILPLDDERFGIALGRMGVWQPMQWLGQTKPGLYMLGEYDPEKTPVLFVHGMSGYPQEFDSIIEGLDTTRFQPWIFLYPSGFRLGIVSHLLRLALSETHVTTRFDRVCLVGHSVGGIVIRDYLGQYVEQGTRDYVRGFVSIAAPLAGIPSAAKGVRMAPEVVPAWYDLVPEGSFIQRLYDQPLPSEVEYHLLVSYIPEQPSDGVVYISSQMRPQAQGEADVVRGYAETHGGVLRSPDVGAQVNVALDHCRGDRPGTPRSAPRSATMAERPAGVEPEQAPLLSGGRRQTESTHAIPTLEETAGRD